MARNLEERHVVTSFLESEGEILILRRSGRVGTYRGRWTGVSGYVETTPDEQALVEIEEEAGLPHEDFEPIRKGEPLTVEDKELGARWSEQLTSITGNLSHRPPGMLNSCIGFSHCQAPG